METKVCKSCERELPVSQFKLTRSGNPQSVCRECCADKLRETRAAHSRGGGGNLPPFSDPSFDNMSIGEVVRLMGRAKKWLESRNCHITLYGDFVETKTKKLKFE